MWDISLTFLILSVSLPKRQTSGSVSGAFLLSSSHLARYLKGRDGTTNASKNLNIEMEGWLTVRDKGADIVSDFVGS